MLNLIDPLYISTPFSSGALTSTLVGNPDGAV
jgi:hypothetical protein